jgi:HSP20 family protein
MKLVRWNTEPAFPDLFNRFLNDDFENYFGKRNCGYLPAANVIEKEDSFEVEFAAPGLNKEDFKINVENNVLTVSSEKEQVKEEKEKNYTRREFAYGAFTRSFALPKTIDIDKIGAAYENGILKVTLPKKEEAKTTLSRAISIS